MHSAMSLRHVCLGSVLMMENHFLIWYQKIHGYQVISTAQRAQNELSSLQHEEVPKMGS